MNRFILFFLLLFLAGCNRSSTPPPPLSLEELPADFQKAFAKAKAEAKALSDEIVAAVQAKEYPKAYIGLQTLVGQSGLSKEQQSLAARAVLAVNTALQTAQAQGDQQAAETLAIQRRMK